MYRAVFAGVVCLARAADFDPGLAARLVNYASATYCLGTDKVTDWTCSGCQNVPRLAEMSQIYGPKHHGRVLVGFDHVLKARIVAIEGTHDDIQQTFDDLNGAVPTLCYYLNGCNDGCKCHPGFVETYYEMAEDVYSAVSKLSPGKLIITGHSLGGAQAPHCAFDLNTKGIRPDHIYTFGQPRVGNAAFADFYSSQKFDHWRITHHRDPVPHWAWRKVFPYEHHVREAYYANAEAGPPTRICSALNGEDPLCTDQFDEVLTTVYFDDHMHYVGLSFWYDWLGCKDGSKLNAKPNSSIIV